MRRSSPGVTIRSMFRRSLLGLAATAILAAAAPLAAQERASSPEQVSSLLGMQISLERRP
jgi:hypothetical protein